MALLRSTFVLNHAIGDLKRIEEYREEANIALNKVTAKGLQYEWLQQKINDAILHKKGYQTYRELEEERKLIERDREELSEQYFYTSKRSQEQISQTQTALMKSAPHIKKSIEECLLINELSRRGLNSTLREAVLGSLNGNATHEGFQIIKIGEGETAPQVTADKVDALKKEYAQLGLQMKLVPKKGFLLQNGQFVEKP